MASTPSLRSVASVAIAVLLMALAPLAGGDPAFAGPIADSPETYAACGRVFPDPHAYWAPGVGEGTPHPGQAVSPWAKGNAPCAARTFITYDEAIRGLDFIANELDVTRDFVDVIDISRSDDPRIREVLREELGDGHSEGLPGLDGEREEVPLYLVKVTAPDGVQLVDDLQPIPEVERDHFVWALSIHGIERAGVEGGVRAIEDLATWASQDPERLLLETYDSPTITTEDGLEAANLRVGEVMMRSVSYFIMPNPDGWRRGDPDQGNASYMRYNGNGMDLNRDWPELGYVDPDFTPWSESESRTYGRVLQNLTDNWTGGIDLHGMVVANAFSYTLIGGSQRPYDKNQRVMQFVQQAWADAEARLSWSPQIKSNDEPEQCVEFAGVAPNGDTHLPPGESCDQRAYGVQYGTIWDTIEYTATGALGNWIDSPVGLNADGIDNEMMLSHLGNCGTGTCYIPEAEQLHVDGNKSLIYAMLNFELQPPPATFEVGGNVAYLVNPRRLVDPGVQRPPAPEGARDADDLEGTFNGSGTIVEFDVNNAAGEEFVQGISGSVRYLNARGEHVGSSSIAIQYFDEARGQWVSRPSYGSDNAVYRTAGEHSDWNYPADGHYRLQLSGAPQRVTWEVELSPEPVWEQPLQEPFDVSNMDFFAELEPFLGPDTTLTALDVDKVLTGERDLRDFDTIIAVDDALLPGYQPNADPTTGLADLPPTGYGPGEAGRMGALLRAFAEGGGNVLLTDSAMQGLEWMELAAPGSVQRRNAYAGHASFNNDARYDHPLAAGLDQPGSAEGANGRRQTVEPIPLGYALNTSMPQWHVERSGVTAPDFDVVATSAGDANRATVLEIRVGEGVVRTFGAVLSFPTTAYYHPFGLSSYAVTDNGYTLLDNLMTWSNPNQDGDRDLSDDEITWVASDTPTRVYVDGSDLSDSFSLDVGLG